MPGKKRRLKEEAAARDAAAADEPPRKRQRGRPKKEEAVSPKVAAMMKGRRRKDDPEQVDPARFQAIKVALANPGGRERTEAECNVFVQLIAALSSNEGICVNDAIRKIKGMCGGKEGVYRRMWDNYNHNGCSKPRGDKRGPKQRHRTVTERSELDDADKCSEFLVNR